MVPVFCTCRLPWDKADTVKGPLSSVPNVKNGIIQNVTTSIWSCMMPKTTVVAGVCNAF